MNNFLPLVVLERWVDREKARAHLVRTPHIVDHDDEDAKANDSIERLTGKTEPPRAVCGGLLEGSLSIDSFEEHCPECQAALVRRGYALLTAPEQEQDEGGRVRAIDVRPRRVVLGVVKIAWVSARVDAGLGKGLGRLR